MRSLLFILDDANDPHSPRECFVYVHDQLFIYAPPGLLGQNDKFANPQQVSCN